MRGGGQAARGGTIAAPARSLICVYTLKNVGHPEYTFSMDSGVMSLDFHPQHPALLAVGCYDGTVKVGG